MRGSQVLPGIIQPLGSLASSELLVSSCLAFSKQVPYTNNFQGWIEAKQLLGASHRPAVQKSVPWAFLAIYPDLMDHKNTRTLGILVWISLNLLFLILFFLFC